ncbi:unnamed protein product, partial [Gulo gulo]
GGERTYVSCLWSGREGCDRPNTSPPVIFVRLLAGKPVLQTPPRDSLRFQIITLHKLKEELLERSSSSSKEKHSSSTRFEYSGKSQDLYRLRILCVA